VALLSPFLLKERTRLFLKRLWILGTAKITWTSQDEAESPSHAYSSPYPKPPMQTPQSQSPPGGVPPSRRHPPSSWDPPTQTLSFYGHSPPPKVPSAQTLSSYWYSPSFRGLPSQTPPSQGPPPKYRIIIGTYYPFEVRLLKQQHSKGILLHLSPPSQTPSFRGPPTQTPLPVTFSRSTRPNTTSLHAFIRCI